MISTTATRQTAILTVGFALLWHIGMPLEKGEAAQQDSTLGIGGDGPGIGNTSETFIWGAIDQNIPLLLGNGDMGGLFDPFGGTTYDELRYGTGRQRDIRTLFLTQLMVPDYWVLEDQAAHFLNPHFYRPVLTRRYLAYGAPFNILLRPADKDFPEAVRDHQQTLDISEGNLKTRYLVGKNTFEIESFILSSDSLLVYRVKNTSPMQFEITGIPSPPL